MTSTNSTVIKIETGDVKKISCSRPEIKSEPEVPYHISGGVPHQDKENDNDHIGPEIVSEKDAPVKKCKNENENNYTYDLGIRNMPKNYKEDDEAFINEVKALCTPILESITEESIKNFEFYNTRYYNDKYCIDFGVKEKSYCDVIIRIHTNKLLLISLASGNDIVRSQRDISDINFMVNNIDRSNIHVKGKKKFGSKSIEPHTILCQVKYQDDDKKYNVRAGINGKIIEINELIKKNPNLIRKDPKGLGFIAVIAPKGHPHDYNKRVTKLNLLSEEEYFQHLLQRPPTITSNN